MSYSVSREHFEKLAEEALKTLPEEYRKYFVNITIIIEDYPGEEDIKKLNTKKRTLLGLFSGVPYTEKGRFFDVPYPLPDRIILFQKNIESISSNEEQLVEEIRKTLIHEVGHYFGFSEKELREYE
ncbi:MAG: metallopeptidase family protein [Nitrospiraceae bacterium]|nr:MAG: metallopeptidase family protein [Nitrospiraceae bacterium]